MALSANCYWTEIDFKDCPKEKATALIRGLRLPPSIVIGSGGGYHLYWLMREPITGDALAKVPDTNRALAALVSGDSAAVDLARVFRIPELVNRKYAPPVRVVFLTAMWPPPNTRRYNPDDFADLVVPAAPAAAPAPGPSAPYSGSLEIDDLPVAPYIKQIILEGQPAYLKHIEETLAPGDLAKKKSEGRASRSEADALVIHALLSTGMSDEGIREVYKKQNAKVAEKSIEVGDKYLTYTIKRMREHLEKTPRANPLRLAEKVSGKVGKEFGHGGFDPIRIVKITYDPPAYEITTTLKEEKETFTTKCSLDDAVTFSKFKRVFFATHDRFPPQVPQDVWEVKVNKLRTEKGFEIQTVGADVASLRGEIESALDEWLTSAQPEKATTDSSINYLPVIDEDGDVHLKLPALMQYVATQKIVATRRQVIDALRSLGYDHRVKRIGKTTAKMWTKERGNGVLPLGTNKK
jgi:hypothetical protein